MLIFVWLDCSLLVFSWLLGIVLFERNCVTILPCIIISTGVHATIQFQPDTEQCLDQLVEYQCTVTRTGFYGLTWRILDDTGIEIGSTSYTSTSLDGAPRSVGEVFTVEQLQQSPIISNISFTVQSSINGYTIVCEDAITLTNENLTINIIGISCK